MIKKTITEKKKTKHKVEKTERNRPITASCVQNIMVLIVASGFFLCMLYGMSSISYTCSHISCHITMMFSWVIYVIALFACLGYIFYFLTTEDKVCINV